MIDLNNYKLPKGKVLVFKSTKNDMSTRNNFIWPEEGEVICKDWKPSKECGNGLHGWLWGNGDYSLKVDAIDAKWLVIEVDKKGIVDLNGKVKFEKGNVIYTGNFVKGFNFIRKEYWKTFNVEHKNEVSATSGDYAHSATSGDSAHSATSGKSAHSATSGYSAHSATSGNYAHSATSGDYAHSATSGDYAHSATSGDSAHSATSGNYAHSATSGDYAHSATSGYSAHSTTSGNSAHSATSGNSAFSAATGKNSTAACINIDGKAKCGKNGSIILTYYDEKAKRNKHVIGYEGEEVETNVWYELTEAGKLIKCKDQNIVIANSLFDLET